MKLFALSMALLLVGCSTAPRTVPHLLIEEVQEACQEPRWGGQTQGELVLHLLDVKRALRGCKAGAEALSNYIKETS
jgi:uncharacterized lipoprotein YmbA